MANKVVVRDRACKQCGTSPITGYKYCSDACMAKATYARKAATPGFAEYNRAAVSASYDRRYGPKVGGRRKRIAEHPCEVCGAPTKRPRCCSLYCARRTAKGKANQYKSTAARRARMKGAFVERVDRIRVFDRDGWLCHICGIVTARNKMGTMHPKAPELDHIVPLSKGGKHSYANTACSCRRCNQSKNNRILGQPSLLAA